MKCVFPPLPTFYHLFFPSSTCPRPLSASPCFRFSKRLHALIPLFTTFSPHVSNRNSLIQRKKECFSCRFFLWCVFWGSYPLQPAWNKYSNRFSMRRKNIFSSRLLVDIFRISFFFIWALLILLISAIMLIIRIIIPCVRCHNRAE